jgi:thiol-disulfide isomerase/thioredoxin
MKKLIIILCAFLLVNCKAEKKEAIQQKATISKVKVPEIKVLDFNQFENYIYQNSDKTYVVNFWATWCKPCVDELPAFEKLNTRYQDKNVEVLLVSLDFSNQLETKVIPFIQKNKIQSEVMILDDSDQNTWIPKVSETWSGAIPATLIYNSNSREFYEQSFTYEELETALNKSINTLK